MSTRSATLMLVLASVATPTRAVAASLPAQAERVAATGLGVELGFDELDQLLVDRYAMSADGRGALKHLMQTHVLEQLAQELGVVVEARQIDARVAELAKELEDSGQELSQLLRKQDVDEAEFRELLRLAIVQEALTRRALDLDDDDPLTGEQQEMWLESAMAERGYDELPPPWGERGVVARCGEVEVLRGEYVEHLRRSLDRDLLRKACYQLLLVRRMQARMQDLAPEALERAIDEEIQRRRKEAENDPRHQGVSYKMLLGAQGLSLAAMPRDPVIRASALSRLWIELAYDAETLRRTYADEREYFDGRYGESLELNLLFLRAARMPNQLNPRTFDEADRELEQLARTLRTHEDFEELARKHSEDPQTRDAGGSLGFVTRGDERVPRIVREAGFDSLRGLPAGATPEGRERLVGPVHLTGGSVLVWLGQRRAAPSWEQMSRYVKSELRQRFIDDALPERSVVTWMDLE